MSTKITFTDDVGEIATAQNANGSVRWHVYERTVGGVTGIFVRREVSGVLEAEVRWIERGRKPEIAFDSTLSQFILFCTVNEALWRWRIDEATAPVEQAIIPLNETIVNVMQGFLQGDNDPSVSAERTAWYFDQQESGARLYTSPSVVNTAAVVGSSTPGMLNFRWSMIQPTSANAPGVSDLDLKRSFIAGFNVYRKDQATDAFTKLNPTLIPFVSYQHIHNFDIPAQAGIYCAVVVMKQGPQGGGLIEGKFLRPRDEIFSNGKEMPTVIESDFSGTLGEGPQSEDARLVFTDRAPIVVVKLDNFPSHGPSEGFHSRISTFTYQVIVIDQTDETFPSHGPNEGGFARIVQTGFGGVVIG